MNPYATHQMTLERLFEEYPIRTVLETGSGRFSTRMFLKQPIERLVSLENSRRWMKGTGDPRHELRLVKGAMCDDLPKLDFDLIFVDDDPLEGRVDTIAAVLSGAPRLVVVHDRERSLVRDAIDRWPRTEDETTAVFWNPGGLERWSTCATA